MKISTSISPKEQMLKYCCISICTAAYAELLARPLGFWVGIWVGAAIVTLFTRLMARKAQIKGLAIDILSFAAMVLPGIAYLSIIVIISLFMGYGPA